MANIKVSEMTEASTFEDDDIAMIVQSNQNKKISKVNLLNSVTSEISNINEDITDITGDISDINGEITDIKGTVLFEYAEQGTVTLSDTITNYKYIEIMAKKTDDDGLFPTQKFYTNNQDNVMLLYNASYGVSGGAYIAGQVFTISGTSVTFTRYYRAIVVGGQTPYAASSTTNVRVLKIIGYK